jgi:Cu/Ag efflux protein CusF
MAHRLLDTPAERDLHTMPHHRQITRVLVCASLLLSVFSPGLALSEERSLGEIGADHGAMEVNATVKKVDSTTGTVELTSDLLGIFGATLHVTPGTRIVAEGKPTTLTSLREGDQVKAAYDVRGGRKTAQWINVLSPPRRGSDRQP